MAYNEILPVETLDNLQIEDFKRHFLKKEQPVKIARAVDDWPAMHKWSLDYFSAEYGDEIIGVETFQPHERGPGNNSPQGYVKNLHFQEIKLGELIQILQNKPDHMYYMASHPFRKSFRNLRNDIRTLPYIKDCVKYIPGAHMDSYLWIGPKWTLTPIHQDPMPNFLTQIIGRKMVYLFPPEQARKNLYIGQFERQSFSPVDIENPDLARYPNYQYCTPYRTTIQPGESLHIPRNWGHCVMSLDISISISTFFITYRQLCTLIPEYCAEYVRRVIQGWRWKEMANERAGINPPPRAE